MAHTRCTCVNEIGFFEKMYLRKTWCSCWAKEAKSAASAKTRPPRTAVNRVDFRRQRATTKGVHNQLPLNWITPIHTVVQFVFTTYRTDWTALNDMQRQEEINTTINQRQEKIQFKREDSACQMVSANSIAIISDTTSAIFLTSLMAFFSLREFDSFYWPTPPPPSST